MTERKVADSLVETIHMVRPQHLNSAGRLFGGTLMQWIDEVAGLVAKRHTHMNITTASVDNLNFLRSAFQKDVVVLIGKMTYVGRTSMEVRVDTYVESMDGVRKPINRAYVTLVALGEDGNPTEVPKLITETPGEKMEWEGALKRREMRDLRRKEGF
ncbi:acyl-CoA thioesterase [Bariatricus massiliensis]|uniref:Acyl-CoA thioesterase n=1 Tax=Bariatricus massiliensis TaxID=1745713 RepID=A0ABS8DE40_9FIRM|nr:acyl-CoA thioesterase [Bariatricus massiliensis]MCB7303277.1 acyl-CoA thioesterase [Bariatricus massiliensis]MCB7373409.1 acyl-CoA thioesterase [Bariatricus massiliensis]MCB7386079.1 acyl-CoA thioesterase [Bariatricus massiliensis]MCB7410241.1 acyl-CoA thioesterase [Bariatricus massiliensis]MCQ5252475.1 acyl-CoA thioesterase [Bariatricus massiliensis]